MDVKWMSSGWGLDINIDTGLICSCYMEQGRVKSDSLLFHITRPKQPCVNIYIVLWNNSESDLTQPCSV